MSKIQASSALSNLKVLDMSRVRAGPNCVRLLADFDDYLAAQSRVDALYRDPGAWATMALRNVAGMGSFSVDRTIREYLERVWR
jgi:starch phosphorylase